MEEQKSLAIKTIAETVYKAGLPAHEAIAALTGIISAIWADSLGRSDEDLAFIHQLIDDAAASRRAEVS